MIIRSEEITSKVDKLCNLQKQMAQLKKEIDELSGFFTVKAKGDLECKKTKSVKYAGTGDNMVTATTSTTLELVHLGVLKKILGKDKYNEIVKKEITYSVKGAKHKRTLAGIANDEYIRSTPRDVISEFCKETGTSQALLNKCKGSFEKDKKALMEIGGLSEDNAEYFAYFISEALTNNEFTDLISQGEYAENFEKAVNELKKSIIAVKTEKIKVTYDEADTTQSA